MSHQDKGPKRDEEREKEERTEKTPPHKAETKKIPPTGSTEPEETPEGAEPEGAEKKEPSEKESSSDTQPMAAYDAPAAGGPLPEIDEGPGAEPVDDIQAALFQAGRQGASGDVEFDHLPPPSLEPSETQEPPEPDEDDIQRALAEETKKGGSGDVSFDDLPEPVPDIDEGPPPEPVDDIQAALFQAGRQGVSPEVDFEALPPPALPPEAPAPRKKISRPVKREPPAEPKTPVPPPKPEPEPEPEPEPPAEPPPPEPTVAPEPAIPPETEPRPAGSVEAPAGSGPALTTDFWLILALFASFRLLTLFLLRPGGFIRDWSDFDTYFGIAALSDYGLLPFVDFWLEWPPLIPWLTVGVYRLALNLPPWPDDPRLWFILILGAVFLLFEIGNFLLIYRLAGRFLDNEQQRTRVLWLYAGLFPPVYAMLGFFDGVALFFILLSLELLLRDQRFPSAIAVGVGVLVKIIPVLMLPVALRRLWDEYKEKPREAGIEMGLYGVAFGLTVIILLLPFLITGPQWVAASARSMLDRSAWETVWAVLEGYYGFGFVAGNRLNPDETAFAVNTAAIPAWIIGLRWGVIALLAGLYLFLLLRPIDYRRPRPLIALAGLTVAFFMLYSKGYSPQFLVYLLPFIILLMPNVRGLTYALILTGLNVLEQPIYFVLLPEARWLLIFTVTVRFILTIIIAAEFALTLWPTTIAWPLPVARLQQRAPLALGGFSALALLILTPLMIRAYSVDSVTGTPVGTLTGFMEALAQNPATLTNCELTPETRRFFLSDQATYRHLYPHLSDDFELTLTAGAPPESDFPTSAQLLPQAGRGWVLPSGPQAQNLQAAATRRGRPLDSFLFEGLGRATFYDFSGNSSAPVCLPPARLGNSIELLAHRLEKSAGQVEVTLYWRATVEPTQNLIVFTQILNSNGQQVAGHDSVPQNGAAPVTTWPVGAVQVDLHTIGLPPGLPPGEYRVIAGLYTDPGQRLRAIGPDGFNYSNQAVPVGSVSLP